MGDVENWFSIEGLPVTANIAVADAIEGLILGSDWLSAMVVHWTLVTANYNCWVIR